MKRILITGAGSYVGSSVERYLNKWPDQYRVDTLDMIGDGWRSADFSGYDAVFHVAGIVHQPKTKDDPSKLALYEKINTHLAVETAAKAKAQGVKQFIFMSTTGVYGLTAPFGKVITITRDTVPHPTDNYGISKLKAEEGLLSIAEDGFKVAILRPPMIYGKGCRGNYCTLAKMARKLPVFPWVDNQRSMLFMDNLSEFIRLIVDDEAEGIFWPQNDTYVNTSEMVNLIAHANGRGILLVKGFGWALKLLRPISGAVDKAFGSLCYDFELSSYPKNYCVATLEESIMATEQ